MKVILLTGATDGIGYETAKRLVQQGHHVLLHGRSKKKLSKMMSTPPFSEHKHRVETYTCDLSKLRDIPAFASEIQSKHESLDVIINNAGVFKLDNAETVDHLDARFAVNTIAPYLITKLLMPQLTTAKNEENSASPSRVINVSSAAQGPVNLSSMEEYSSHMSDNAAYAQSKLGIMMWTNHLVSKKIMTTTTTAADGSDSCPAPSGKNYPTMVSINPSSFLGSKMVKEAYGMAGKDLGIGADILVRGALSDEFGPEASGKYFDNDSGRFASPHPDATNKKKCELLVQTMENILGRLDLN
eukprot:CAMPEP_0119567930 /NCGR_PEP_ID=MMETSP1352-20130426/37400_1 /TAXON_ID=265584 /ORGANISM="Stauroneis constricta, Strain CCMP1120" /LENGTH=299 /DNA_ID=CAMNT_0007617253 /DNA_START=159 /DNA_END=1058 /DNA_ORIENTATION=-